MWLQTMAAKAHAQWVLSSGWSPRALPLCGLHLSPLWTRSLPRGRHSSCDEMNGGPLHRLRKVCPRLRSPQEGKDVVMTESPLGGSRWHEMMSEKQATREGAQT